MSSIEWTDVTWNPVRGCSRVSEGCRNCYAERMAARFAGAGKPFHDFIRSNGLWTGAVRLVSEKLDEPLRWRKPRRVFVNSMSDLFHEALPFEDVESVFRMMDLAERHTFQILTKRPERMREFCLNWSRKRSDRVIPNVWLGVSVEDQKTADERIPPLLATPAALRFVSYEPALAPVDFHFSCVMTPPCDEHRSFRERHPLDWVIVGGESGPGARPFGLAWARSVVAQCREIGVPCFVKQLGSRWAADQPRRGTNAKGGDPDEWPEDLRVREFPAER